jgi:ACS family hexuronate transporter-like MFS transporter
LAVSYSGGSLGALVTPVLATPIFLWWGWRDAFWFTGLIGAVWLAVWAAVSRRPDIHGAPMPASGQESESARPRWNDPGIWAFMCAYALGALPLGFVLYSSSLYLARALGCSQEFIGKVLWIPPLGWEAGYFVWGWLGDRSLRKKEPRVLALQKLMTVCVLLNLPFAAIPWMPSVATVLGSMFLAMFVASGFVVLSIAYATHIYSADHAGLIAGTGAGSWSLMVALLMPVFGRIFDLHQYFKAFWIAAAIPVLGYCAWLWLARARSRYIPLDGARC